jgi:hypothetical protein
MIDVDVYICQIIDCACCLGNAPWWEKSALKYLCVKKFYNLKGFLSLFAIK